MLTTANTKQSKSLGDLLEMDPLMDAQETQALKKALEWELSLDSRDLRSHAWYHGPIPRTRAEEIVIKEGDFLIRDCVSQPGNFVLTCKTKAPVLHFVINKVRFFFLLLLVINKIVDSFKLSCLHLKKTLNENIKFKRFFSHKYLTQLFKKFFQYI